MLVNLRSFLAGSTALIAVALSGCVPTPAPTPTPVPAPAPRPAPAPAPASPPPSPPFAGNWMDAPLTPGDWRYAAGTAAFFGADGNVLLTMRCAAGAITIDRAGVGSGLSPTLIIRSEFTSRALSPTVAAGAPGSTAASVDARDPLLDSIAFSKGRFAVESAGLPTLYIPPYPEVTRVIEDCR